MDHLPKPREGHATVHFYGTRDAKYRPGDFYKIPMSKPWKHHNYEDLIEKGLRPDLRDGDANTFLTSWLFFGLLAEVLNRDIDSSDFYKQDQKLSTKKLNFLLKEWLEQDKADAEANIDHNLTQYIRTSNTLKDARRFISKHCSLDRIDRDDPAQPRKKVDSRFDPGLTLAIAILGETLQRERPQMRSHISVQAIPFYDDTENREMGWGNSVFCRNQMIQNRWCKFDIHRLESTISEVSIIYYVSQLKPLVLCSLDDHKDCSMSECIARETNPCFQTALHLCCNGDQCKCEGGDETQLVKWIEEGKTPLVRWTDEKGLEFEAFDLTIDNGVIFGALTHGWDDGLLWSGTDARGKNNRRMLLCQIERAQETFDGILKEIHKDKQRPDAPAYFWVDVLCLPRHAPIRSKAINQMKAVYRKAYAVLIWDRTLIQSRKLASMIEVNMRLRLSNWSKRLWTLQESVLAKRIYVEFCDGVVSHEEIHKERDLARDNLDHAYHHIWKAGHPFRHATWKLRKDPDHQVARAWGAVQFLMVTQPADETMVLANILGLDVTQLININGATDEIVGARRMVKFLDMLDKARGLGIPSGIIFVPGPKLLMEGVEETRGFGWAPRTWLSRQGHSYPLTRPLRQAGTIMPHGLLVKFPGVTLDCAGLPPEANVFWVPLDQGMYKWMKVVVDYTGRTKDWKDFWANHVCTYSELSIIMCTARPADDWEIGCLAQTKEYLTQGEIKWVKVICRVWFRRETNMNIVSEKTSDFRKRKGPLMFGVRFKSPQQWCVDGDED